jgi:integrase/recombinase XerD
MKAYLELPEIELMEEVASCQRDRLLIRLLSHLGCRISEALALKVEDIDFEQSTITILHLKRSIKLSCPTCKSRLGNRHRFCPGCGSKVNKQLRSQMERKRIRVLPVDENTLEMTRSYINSLSPINNKTRLFNINRHRAWQIVRDCAIRASLPSLVNHETGRVRGISPHRLRDAFSVHAMKVDDSGDGLRLLQEHLGHVSFNTTAKYRKIAGEEHRDWYRRLWGE